MSTASYCRRFSDDERRLIEKLLKENCTTREVATRLGRVYSSVKNEIRKHGGKDGYRAETAITDAIEAKNRQGHRLQPISKHEEQLIKEGLAQGLSHFAIREQLPLSIGFKRLKKIIRENPEWRIQTVTTLEDRITALEMQVEILTDMIKETRR